MRTNMSKSPFGQYLRSKRVAAGLSLREVADKIGVTHVYLGEVERGVHATMPERWWGGLTEHIPGVTREDLARYAANVRPLQLDLSHAPPRYQDLGLALARRIQDRDLSGKDVSRLLEILRGGREE
jgi:transcriptional regulator with XRE-family HTH domain